MVSPRHHPMVFPRGAPLASGLQSQRSWTAPSVWPAPRSRAAAISDWRYPSRCSRSTTSGCTLERDTGEARMLEPATGLSSGGSGRARARGAGLLQLDEREPVAPGLLFGLLLTGRRLLRPLLRGLGWLRDGPLRRLRRRRGGPRRRHRVGLVQRSVVDAARSARHALAADELHRDALPVDANGDVLAVDDEALEDRVSLRGLEPLQHLRERLLAGGVGGQLGALARPRQRQHSLHHVGGEELGAELDQLVARHRPEPGAQLGRDLRRRIQVLSPAAHAPDSAGRWQPMVVAPEKSAPVSAASRRSTPISVARAKEAPIRFAPRIETSIRRAPEKSAFSIEATPNRASAKTVRTISAPSNRARYSLVSSKRATASCAPEKTAFIASQPWIFSRRALICAASISFRSQK